MKPFIKAYISESEIIRLTEDFMRAWRPRDKPNALSLSAIIVQCFSAAQVCRFLLSTK